MLRFLLRTVWRLLILGFGLVLGYASAFIAFPYLDKRLPFFIAFILVYIGVAYFGLPWIIRFWRVVFKPNHIPLYTTTTDGIPSDPVNIAIVAKSKHQLTKAMKKAGWYVADKASLRNTLREGWALLLDRPYLNAPFSALYLFNRHFDLGFQIPYGKNKSPRYRHHVRFWQLVDKKEDHGHFRFWSRHFRGFLKRKRIVWIGAAIDDVSPYGIRWYNLQVTHRNHPKHHQERDYIIQTLKEAGLVKSVTEIKSGEPFAVHSQNIGINFVSDGRLKIVELS